MYHKIHQGDRLYEEVVQQIQGMILNGELKPRDRLPTESELATKFGVSRTVVREAVEGKELIRLFRPGTFVTAPSANTVTGSFSLFLRMEHPSPQELLEARRLLEIEIAGLAAERAQPENLEKLGEYLVKMEQKMGTPPEFVLPDRNFHRELAKAAHNVVLQTVIEPLLVFFGDTLEMVVHVPGSLQRAMEHHHCIYEKIKARDRAGAREAMSQHLEQVRQDTEKGLLLPPRR
jgi:GntR family transcriptional repressor for pyruvate dehydrogenase complex